MFEWSEIPEFSLNCFTKTTGLSVSIHDCDGSLLRFLPPENHLHQLALCRLVKLRHDADCCRFDGDLVRRISADRPEGFVKICPAGAVEWVVPSFAGAKLGWVIFAGLRRPGRGLRVELAEAPRPEYAPAVAELPPVEAEEAPRILEMLRQLVARLEQWRQADPARFGRRSAIERQPELERRIAIRQFIRARHCNPIGLADLAEHLHLSPGRTAHAVREACGRTFLQLLHQERLRSAAELLRHSELTVVEIALQCGFADASHFHRLFRRTFQVSPHRYRRDEEVKKSLQSI